MFEAEINIALGNKDQYRGSDFRYSVIVIYQRLKDALSTEMKQLLHTLIEICHIAYQPSLLRTSKCILRLYNVSFLHAYRCVQIFGENPKLNKFYGIYYHALTVHLADINRLIAPSSLYTESEERIFGTIRGITRSTSQRDAASVRDVGIVRFVSTHP